MYAKCVSNLLLHKFNSIFEMSNHPHQLANNGDRYILEDVGLLGHTSTSPLNDGFKIYKLLFSILVEV